ncbi:MAG TPA: hypothetical protein PK629_06240 [Oscillospiraceae bacterium]|nr:hypothetical protein [Oscillospiraceae bacterium]HPF55589.1 hypothetical protein [Clostridiales bacterium]HPK35824.1 hypothetical protein [Oscillospiraceae bacterium]HPR76342.1 hypothetical protein [Oscillospiraceae bacterium]
MNSFKDDLNQIKAEAALKEKTMAFVRTELAKSEYERMGTVRTETVKKENPFMKKMIGALSAVAACALLAVGGFVFYNTPLNYVSFDVNPSVELGINAFDQVVTALAYNDDGEQLLAGTNVIHQSLEDAVSNLVEQADEQGYIMDDGSSVIAVTAESNNEQTAAQIQATCENTITLTLNKGETTAVVYTDAISLKFAQQARESGVSPGKYRLIEVLQSLDPTVTVDQYKNAKVSEIIAAAGEMLDQNGNAVGNNGNGNGQGNADNADALQRIRNAIKAQTAEQTKTQTQSMTLGESGNGETYTEQNQNQNANQNKNSETQDKEQEKEQNKAENGNPTTASPATPANNGNGNSNTGTASGSSDCSSDCSSCSSSCVSDGSGAQSDNGNSNAGGNGKG